VLGQKVLMEFGRYCGRSRKHVIAPAFSLPGLIESDHDGQVKSITLTCSQPSDHIKIGLGILEQLRSAKLRATSHVRATSHASRAIGYRQYRPKIQAT
jgi:hypothetical protein